MIILTAIGYFLAGTLIGSLFFKNSWTKKLINLACAGILLTPSDLIGNAMQGMLIAKIAIVLLGVMGIIFFTRFKAKRLSHNHNTHHEPSTSTADNNSSETNDTTQNN